MFHREAVHLGTTADISPAADGGGNLLLLDHPGECCPMLDQATSARKPTFLQRERWKASQKARCNGISLRAIERELGIHRSTTRKYLYAEGPPTRQSRAGPTASSSDTIAA